MDPYLVQIVESLSVLAIVFLLRYLFQKSTRKMALTLHLNPDRKRLMAQTVNTFLSILGIIALIAIWSIDTKELIFFISSLITALGIAFLAQWSVLSNITASMVLFFKHPLRIGEPIKILDKDYPISGKLLKISLFFMHIELENGEHITIPNNIVLNKIISVKMD
jgi:small-conductance mechanosensitive channel|tara:strand:- start:4887 stop:5381 length:495 start_codon:yes stop_codon:yes gene_type:complete